MIEKCGGVIDEKTTREELVARGFKPEAADEVLRSRDRLAAKAKTSHEESQK